MKRTVSVRSWLLVLLIVALGGLAGACSSGDDDASETPKPGEFGDAANDTPSAGTDADGSAATLEPGEAGESGDDTDGEPGEPGASGGARDAEDQPPVPTSDGVMRLTIVEGGFCNANECFVDIGSTFTLAVEVLSAPASNYVLLQTFIDFGVYDPGASEDGAGPGTCGDGVGNGGRDGVDRTDEDCVRVDLVYIPSESATDEIVWADLSEGTGLRSDMGPGLLIHGGITGLIPPLPTSSETGIVVQFQMRCPANAVRVPMTLLVYNDPIAKTNGSVFVEADGSIKFAPNVSPITLICE